MIENQWHEDDNTDAAADVWVMENGMEVLQDHDVYERVQDFTTGYTRGRSLSASSTYADLVYELRDWEQRLGNADRPTMTGGTEWGEMRDLLLRAAWALTINPAPSVRSAQAEHDRMLAIYLRNQS